MNNARAERYRHLKELFAKGKLGFSLWLPNDLEPFWACRRDGHILVDAREPQRDPLHSPDMIDVGAKDV